MKSGQTTAEIPDKHQCGFCQMEGAYTGEVFSQRRRSCLFSAGPPASAACVGGIVVSIAAFQAVDPGSIPGQRISFGSGRGRSGAPSATSGCTKNFWTSRSAAAKSQVSPSGNRTPVFRVTGGDTVHYTNEESCTLALSPSRRDITDIAKRIAPTA
ncbi:putative thymopoietin [Labeo rohita]|uniref:Putative thymopoietin n=1 Tax=Labeo rohita TaxID=84645 RepID=A0A498NFR5_LABRO|nr:putative thymopoietin [Labeo rohita]